MSDSSQYLPMCAKCGTRVDRIAREAEDPRDHSVLFEVECHGKIEHVRLSARQMHDMGPNAISAGVAFLTEEMCQRRHLPSTA